MSSLILGTCFIFIKNSTIFNIDNYVSWAPDLNIRMIYEGPCDTEDWSNDGKAVSVGYSFLLHLKGTNIWRHLFVNTQAKPL